MSTTFEELLARQKSATIGEMSNAIKASSPGGKFEKDSRLWKPTVNAAGNAYAIIRFLPAPDLDVDWVKFYSHDFNVGQKWLIEKCPTSLGEQCPVYQ